MRTIDADDLVKQIDEFPTMPSFLDILEMIKEAPTIDIEPRRGKWIEVSFNEKIKYMVCSECGNKYAVDLIVPLEAWIDEKHKFCGLCGADMRGTDDE